MSILKKSLALPFVLGILFFTACKKDKVGGDEVIDPSASASDKIKDSTLLYTRDLYLWYKQIPATFNARSYDDPAKIMIAIRKYSMEPGFAEPVDKWSFAVKQAEWDKVSSGIAGDFGINVFFRTADDLRVKAVEPNSAAGKAGIRRGWRIVKINGSENITTANVNFVVQNVFESNSTTFSFQKPDNSIVNITLNASSYKEQPVLLDTIYNVNSKKIGYLVFNSFLGDTTQIYNSFSRIFTGFTATGINDLIIDLRYNGGGYVSVAEKLGDYIVPPSGNGNVMMKQQFNDKYTQYNSVDYFNKKGSLNLPRVFFIVSSSSASASELLINNLKPYMDVILLGASKTYGKPVGFFPIPVADWYIFPVSFKTVNKNGEGNYYGGFNLNNQVADGLDKDWGDLNESSLKGAVSYISSGVFGRAGNTVDRTYKEIPEVKAGNTILDEPSFKGSIDTRRLK